MSYVSLYRKYRPQNFDEVIGQRHIVRTLKNQVKTGNVSHAYLFTGTRGTGKTTCAKIFAKAVNCENPDDGSPCGQCAVCKSIAGGYNYDVLEIDAASNNGVDEIRDLRDMVKYAPTAGKYKVFIIDEVHMLSGSAHNALLKTLEEPPGHVIFILATTEAHKLPATILSRCQRFDFRLVSVDDLADRISFIFNDIKKPIEPEAITAIAEAGDGSVRDALSVADICFSYSEGAVTYADVLEVLGANSPEVVLGITADILKGDTKTVLEGINKACTGGKNAVLLGADIAKVLRNVIFVKNCDNAYNALGLSEKVYEGLKEISDNNDNQRLIYVLTVMSGIEAKQKTSHDPRLVLESAAIQAANLKAGYSEDAMLERIRELENKLSMGMTYAPSAQASAAPQDIAERDKSIAKSVWGYVIRALRQRKLYSAYSAATTTGNEVTFGQGVLKIYCPDETDYRLLSAEHTLAMLEKTANEASSIVRKVEVTDKKADEIIKAEKTTLEEDIEEVKQLFDGLNVEVKK